MKHFAVVYLLSNVFGTYTIYKFMHIFFQSKNKFFEILSYIIYFIVVNLLNFGLNIPVVNLVSNLIMFFLLTFNYSSTWKTRLTATAYLSAILISIEALAIIVYHIFLSHIWVGNDKIQTILIQIISKIISYVVVLAISNFKLNQTETYIPPLHWIAVFLIPLGTLISTFLLMTFNNDGNFTMIFIIISFLILIDIFVFYLYDILLQYYQGKLEKNLLIQQNNAYLKQLTMISQSQENMKLLRHDIKNHISVLRSLMETDNSSAALKYMENTLVQIENSNEFAKSGNTEIDSILNYKLYEAKKNGIETVLKLHVPELLNIPSFDLVVILSNLLDNAIEASSKLENNRKMEISVQFDRNVLYIRVSNSYSGMLRYEDNKLKTTHKEAENHGLGLTSVKNSVDKYNGTMKISHTEQMFYVDILIYIPSSEG